MLNSPSRNDPDAIYVFRARVTAVAFGLAGGAMGYGIGLVTGATGWRMLLSVFASALAAGVITRYLITGVIGLVGRAVAGAVLPSGRSTPYENSYSYEQSLAARGDLSGATEAYRAAIAAHPQDPEPCLQAAELLARSGEAAASAELFRQGRERALGDRARELYATQRLIDLYLGPLGDTGRAPVELRRLIERFPGTKESDAARRLLAQLKEEAQQQRPRS